MKIAIEDGAVRYATENDGDSPRLQVVKGIGSDVVFVTYILTGTARTDVLTLPLSQAVVGWEFFQMGIDRHTDFSVEAIRASIWPSKSRM